MVFTNQTITIRILISDKFGIFSTFQKYEMDFIQKIVIKDCKRKFKLLSGENIYSQSKPHYR